MKAKLLDIYCDRLASCENETKRAQEAYNAVTVDTLKPPTDYQIRSGQSLDDRLKTARIFVKGDLDRAQQAEEDIRACLKLLNSLN